jgi:hypothetical protein
MLAQMSDEAEKERRCNDRIQKEQIPCSKAEEWARFAFE